MYDAYDAVVCIIGLCVSTMMGSWFVRSRHDEACANIGRSMVRAVGIRGGCRACT